MHTKINFIMNLVGRALHHYSLFLLSYPLSIKAVKSQMAVGPKVCIDWLNAPQHIFSR